MKKSKIVAALVVVHYPFSDGNSKYFFLPIKEAEKLAQTNYDACIKHEVSEDEFMKIYKTLNK